MQAVSMESASPQISLLCFLFYFLKSFYVLFPLSFFFLCVQHDGCVILFLQRLASWAHQDLWDPMPLYPFQAGTPPRDTCMSGFGFAVRKGNYLMLLVATSGSLFLVFLKFSRHSAFTLLCPPSVILIFIELFLGKPCVFLGGKRKKNPSTC